MAASSQGRPGSSGSRLSRSHIPSLTAQAFFRPMSSQRLQAHRGGRPMTKGTVSSTDEWPEHTNQNRRSLISNSTLPQGSAPPTEVEAPPSRGTEFTDPVIPDRNTSNASPMGNTTIRSLGESVQLLRDRERQDKARPSHLNLSANYNGHTAQDAAPKSPLSFLSLQNKGSAQNSHDARGHERLSSAGSSPQPVDVKKERAPRSNSGKNWEYFTGNTLFCAGGRLQNSRDKPINIATGILVVVPAALFFGFSYGDPLFRHAIPSRANPCTRAPWLWHNISPAIPILFAYLFYICLSSFIHASSVDPGVSQVAMLPCPILTTYRSCRAMPIPCHLQTLPVTPWHLVHLPTIGLWSSSPLRMLLLWMCQ